MTHRYLTVCGEVARPMVARVPLGISLGEVIDLAGGAVKDDYDILVGGPMMGKVADSPETPVDKTCSGVIVLPKGALRDLGQGGGSGADQAAGPDGLLPVQPLHRPLPPQSAGPLPPPP